MTIGLRWKPAAMVLLCALWLFRGTGAWADGVDWSGVWVADRVFGPAFRGPVDIQKVDDRFVARVQGESAPVTIAAHPARSLQWAFEFPGHGRFVGIQAAPSAEVTGHWIQVPGVVQGYPFATPLTLRSAGETAWRGHIAPFMQEISLNIFLERSPGRRDTYRTFLRNPQRNLGRFFRIETAIVKGDEIRFRDADGDVLATGRAIEPGVRFDMDYPRFGESMDFVRRPRDDAPGFYPRRLPRRVSTLPAPLTLSDGWPTASPAASGLDAAVLATLLNELAHIESTRLSEPYIHSLLIAHRGHLVVEEYYHGYHRNTPHDSRSAGKSLASALLGIAIYDGLIKNEDAPAYSFFGGVDEYANPDPRKERITLRHLVTMSSGFHCDDGSYDNPGNEDIMQNQGEQPDWHRYALNLPMVREPGEAGVYCTSAINLLGGALSAAAGTSLLRFLDDRFARPLGIMHYHANLAPTEVGYMGGGIRFRPRDFLKLGQLYLDGGTWQGERLVHEDWVRQSFAPHASINVEDDYGYGWWRQTFVIGERAVSTYYASGNGGQLLFVVPELKLVVLIHAGNYSDGYTRNAFRDRFMGQFILPAALPPD